jgi:hypothetical protein
VYIADSIKQMQGVCHASVLPPVVMSPCRIHPMGGDVAISTCSILQANARSGGGRVLGRCHSPPIHRASRGSQRCWWCHPHLPQLSSSPLPSSLDRLHPRSTLRAVARRRGGRCWVIHHCRGVLGLFLLLVGPWCLFSSGAGDRGAVIVSALAPSPLAGMHQLSPLRAVAHSRGVWSHPHPHPCPHPHHHCHCHSPCCPAGPLFHWQ